MGTQEALNKCSLGVLLLSVLLEALGIIRGYAHNAELTSASHHFFPPVQKPSHSQIYKLQTAWWPREGLCSPNGTLLNTACSKCYRPV